MSTLDEIRRLLREAGVEGNKPADDAAFIERLEKLSAQMQGIVNIKPDEEETAEASESSQNRVQNQPVEAGSGI